MNCHTIVILFVVLELIKCNVHFQCNNHDHQINDDHHYNDRRQTDPLILRTII